MSVDDLIYQLVFSFSYSIQHELAQCDSKCDADDNTTCKEIDDSLKGPPTYYVCMIFVLLDPSSSLG